jgi:hypothetical protein
MVQERLLSQMDCDMVDKGYVHKLMVNNDIS